MIKFLTAYPVNESGPESIGNYTLIRKISEGRTTCMYEVRDSQGETLAMKVLKDNLAGDKPHLLRFYAQAKFAMLFNRPTIVDVREVREAKGRHYFTMQYYPRGSLSEHLDENARLPEPAAIRLVARLAEALQTLHAAGFIHRDIAPANILLADDMQPVLSDFGSCYDCHRKYNYMDIFDGNNDSVYAPPEQFIDTKSVDPTFDVYALGVLLCRCITGRTPFASRSEYSNNTCPVSRRSLQFLNDGILVSPATAALIHRCIEANPNNRPRSAWEFASEAHKLLNQPLPKSWQDIPKPEQLSCSADWYLWTLESSGLQLRKTTQDQLIRFILRGQVAGTSYVTPHLGQQFKPISDYPVFSSLFGKLNSTSLPVGVMPRLSSQLDSSNAASA